MYDRELGPEMPDFYELDGVLVRLDYLGPPEVDGDDDGLALMMAESPGLYMPSMYSLTEVATGASHEFLVFGEGGFSPYEMAMHLAVSRMRAVPLPPPPTMREDLLCEHGMDAALCAGPGHYPMDGDW